ncbi:Putative 2-hydroxyacid dehydrogenase [Neomoorella glycerini]|uniref:2-hydroxyacid dehydrogenase n=1 Tax=Neomoorella glycerini TaxID=55779 RepID=A0A6I5ZUC9_9FIRM|nr:D-glycerate dehydrogenase [Moorella glycerini]QGP93127.1 Putative 2-hydroxyacid dehydrogenase [Moorella glycerini]
MYKVYCTTEYPQPLVEMLCPTCELDVNISGRPASKEEIIARVRDKDGLICLLNDVIDEEIIAQAPKLKVITLFAESTFNIDVAAATRRGILVTNTPGELTETTADLTWALLMAVARRIPEADAYVRQGRFKGWAPTVLLGGDIYGKTLGIIGLGNIGAAVARRARGFNMKVIYYSASGPKPDREEELGCRYVPLDRLLRDSDFVSVHCRLTPQTRHLLGAHELSLMKKTAYLINTARGPVVDEMALVEALRQGRLAGAGLDVFENEPQLAPGLADLPNVVLTPHIGVASRENRFAMARIAAANLLAALHDQVPPNLVNEEVRKD